MTRSWILQVLLCGMGISLAALLLHRGSVALRTSAAFRYRFLQLSLLLMLLAPAWPSLVAGLDTDPPARSAAPAREAPAGDRATAPVSTTPWRYETLEANARSYAPLLAHLLFCAYLSGLVIHAARLAGAAAAARKLVSRSRIWRIEGLWEVRLSDEIAAPMSLGALKPVILLPAGMPSRLDTTELEMVLVHESVHIARRDHWAQWTGRIVEVLWFFWPLIPRISRAMELEMELSCDELVLRTERFSRRSYGALLVDLAAHSSSQAGWAGLGMSKTGSSNLKRRILNMKNPIPKCSKAAAAAMLALFVAISAGLSAQAIDRPRASGVAVEIKLSVESPAGLEEQASGARLDYDSPTALEANGVRALIKLSRSAPGQDQLDLEIVRREGEQVLRRATLPFTDEAKLAFHLENAPISKVFLKVRKTAE